MILCNNNLQIYSKLKFHFTFKYFTILVSHNNLLIEVAQSVSQKTQSFVEGTQSEIVLELIFISGATCNISCYNRSSWKNTNSNMVILIILYQ